jgi:vacuolar-type H+-ATPase subunit I/STV1
MRAALALVLVLSPLAAARKPTVAQLQAQVKHLTEERDELKQRLAATEDLSQELASAQKARDLAKAEADASHREIDQIRAALKENQGGGDAMLKELKQARQAASEAQAESARMKSELEVLQQKLNAAPSEGALVMLTDDIHPARPLNLYRITPRVKASGLFASRPKGVVVVQVLINEKGEVLSARLIQGLPGDEPDAKAAGEACVEAAKRIVFDPATSKDGKTRFQVWQGVGFYLD